MKETPTISSNAPPVAGRHRRQGALDLTRRAFLAGAGGALAAKAAEAAPAALADFWIDEREDGVTVSFRNARCVQPASFKIPRAYWAPSAPAVSGQAVLTVTDVAEASTPDGETHRVACVDIFRAQFAGTKPFRARFEFGLVGPDCRVSLATTGWPLPGITRFRPLDFLDFASGGQVLARDLSPGEAAGLVQSLFGPRLRFAGRAALSLDNALAWRIVGQSAEGFSTSAALVAGDAGQPLRFGKLRFAPAPTDGGPFDADTLAYAFPDQAPGDHPSGALRPVPICGASEGPVTLAGTAIELGRSDGTSVTAEAARVASVAFQHYGDRDLLLSGASLDALVSVSSDGAREGPFVTKGGHIARFGRGGREGAARLPLADKPFAAETRHGRFVVDAPDPIVARPGAAPLGAGVALTTSGGRLTSFAASALLRQAFLPFPSMLLGRQRAFFSRLDFAGGAVTFLLARMPQSSLWSSGTTILIGPPTRPSDPSSGPPVRLSLDQAKLRVVRPDDLLSLAFTFSGLALVHDGRTGRVVPMGPGSCGVHAPRPVNAALRAGGAQAAAFEPGATVDDRPVMVVEFPPQHVAERAYLRRIDDGEDPPDIILPDDVAETVREEVSVLSRYAAGCGFPIEARIAARRAVQCAKLAVLTSATAGARAAAAAAAARAYVTDAIQARAFTAKAAPPPEAARAAGEDCDALLAPVAALERLAKQAEDAQKAFGAFAVAFEREAALEEPHSDRWPDDQLIYAGSEWLDPDVRRFARRLAARLSRRPDKAVHGWTGQASARDRLPAVDFQDPDFARWQSAYERWGERLFGGLPRYCGPDGVQALVDAGQLSDAGLAMLVARIEAELGEPEAFEKDGPTPARLSSPTRLAFRINCDDFEGGGGGFDFTLERLTDWSRFDLSVVRRAEKLLDFDRSGRLPPHWARREVQDAASTLAHQLIGPAAGPGAVANGGKGTAAQRMAEVAAAAGLRPSALETAIELPFRLVLSPAQDARWRTPMLGPREGARLPLWQASLDEEVSRRSVRAVWSDDFRPDAFGGGGQPPAQGAWAPWCPAVPGDDGGAPHSLHRFRAVMDARDRHELVALTSLYGLPAIGRRDAAGRLVGDGDQVEPPPGYGLRDLDGTDDAIYMPRPLAVNELALSSLGGSLTLDTHFEPPGGPLRSNQPLFQALNVEQWRHSAVLGRDIAVQVVYKGFLYPLGHRAAYVKTTERRFMRHPRGGPVAYLIQRLYLQVGHPRKAFPALGQAYASRAFPSSSVTILTKRSPDLVDPTDRPPVHWSNAGAADGTARWHEYANGAVALSADGKATLPGLVFWPRTGSSPAATVSFEMQFDDAGGSVTMPLLFVDNAAAHNPDTLAALTVYYNALEPGPRASEHHGAPRRYAAEGRPGQATFQTDRWLLRAEGGPSTANGAGPGNTDFAFTAPLEGADQPPFYPVLDSCDIRLNQVAKLTGGPAPRATARYYPDYVIAGFEPGSKNAAETFLVIDGELPKMQFGAQGERAAGIGRPEQEIVALSRRNGPIGGQASLMKLPASGILGAAAQPLDVDFSNFKPKDFFGDFGKLLGIIDLGTVIRIAAGLAGMPQLAETIDYASEQGWEVVRESVLQPLAGLAEQLDAALTSIETGPGGSAARDIGSLFKDFAAAKRDLVAAVDAALAAAEPAIDEQARLVGAVYEKSRSLIAALERLASDPIGQVTVALRQQLDAAAKALLPVTVEAATALSGALTAGIVALVSKADLYGVLFDPAHFIDGFSDSLSASSRKALLDTLAPPPDENEVRAHIGQSRRLLDVVVPILRERIAAHLPELAAAERQAVETAEATIEDAIRGPLYGVAADQLDALFAAQADLAVAVAAISREITADAVFGLLKAYSEASQKIGALVEQFPTVVAQDCDAAVLLIQDLAAGLATGSDYAADDLKTIKDCVADGQACDPALPSPGSFARLALTDLAEIASSGKEADLRGWAATFRAKILADLDACATELLVLAGRTLPASEVGLARAACQQLDLAALRRFVGLLTPFIDARKALADRALRLASDLVDGVRSFRAAVKDTTDVKVTRDTAAAILDLIGAAVRLFVDPTQPPIPKIADAVDRLAAGTIEQAQSGLGLATLSTKIAAVAGRVARARDVEGVREALDAPVEDDWKRDVTDVLGRVADYEVKAFAAASRVVSAAATQATAVAAGALFNAMGGFLLKGLGIAAEVYQSLYDARTGLLDEIAILRGTPVLGSLLQPLTDQVTAALEPKGINDAKGALADASAAIEELQADPNQLTNLTKAKTKLGEAVSIITRPNNPFAAASKALTGIAQAILKGDIGKLIDVDAPRREIEALVRDLIPHKATMAYALDTELQPVLGIFIPDKERGDGRLAINTTTVVDLTGTDPPKTTVQGTLDPFIIHLFGDDIDVVQLVFQKATFGSAPGQAFSFRVDLETVVLGKMVEFLQALESYLTPADGNGFYLRPASGTPGIEVGYGLNLGTISLGPVSFINVGLNAGCRLPFDNRSAQFTIGLSRPDAPFLISAGIYGGGGYLGLVAEGTRIVGFEASFEFGGVAAFSFGPLTGIGMLTTGITVRKLGDGTTIDGFFFCGGSARIACFGIAASLSVTIGMQPGGAMTGQALFSFSFSIGFAHVDFHVTVFKTQSKLGGGQSAAADGPTRLAAVHSDYEALTIHRKPPRAQGPRIHATTLSPERDWRQYRRYFACDLKPSRAR